jgi:protein-L-isoaspartate O-methyltransferase
MTSSLVAGTEGYAEEAEDLLQRYESIPAAENHRHVLHLIPKPSSRVLDIGSGTGRDAGWFASLGHLVLAVEPTAALRVPAAALHPTPQIEWLDDSLPDLAHVQARGETFDLIMLTAVWMHLDEAQRRHAMPKLACLLRSNGALIIKLRHGPVPPGRRMFEISAEETVRLAQIQDLRPVLNIRAASNQEGNRAAGVSWTSLAFLRG